MKSQKGLCPLSHLRFRFAKAIKSQRGLCPLFHLRFRFAKARFMKILAIDTSCDDTSISVLEVKDKKDKIFPDFKILVNIVSSQIKVHQKYGGVYPSLAKREHQRNLPIVLKKALKEAGFETFNFQFPIFKQIQKSKIPNINFIAVTIGPGLDPCLWTGLNFAKSLSIKWNIPIIPVNHIEGHILANFIGENLKSQTPNFKQIPSSNDLNPKQIEFPAICLIVSGGHTQLILMKKIGKGDEDKSSSSPFAVTWEYKIIGETRDDAAGECFDKTARILGLPYPGGPAIAKEAIKSMINDQLSVINDQLLISLPRPMINSKNYDFSFSGLKTAVLYDFKKRSAFAKTPTGKSAKKPKEKYVRAMAKEIQQSIIDVLIKKTFKAVREYKAKTLILGGGVIANEELRGQFEEKIKTINHKLRFLAPQKIFCTDNAGMIAIAGYFNREKATKKLEEINTQPNLRL